MRTRKRSKMTERDFRFSICCSAIGQFDFSDLRASPSLPSRISKIFLLSQYLLSVVSL